MRKMIIISSLRSERDNRIVLESQIEMTTRLTDVIVHYHIGGVSLSVPNGPLRNPHHFI